MNDDLERLDARIDALADRLRRVEERLSAEGAEGLLPPEPAERAQPVPRPRPTEGVSGPGILPLVGRSLVVLGGAFLLRWATQSGYLPHQIGSLVGMIYALLWIAMADISAGRGQRQSGVFHGVTGAFIALPLLVEATTTLRFLTPPASAASLFAFVVLGLVVAGRRRLRILAWLVALPAAPLTFVLSFQTQALTPFLLCLLVLGFVTLWLGYLRRWQILATLMAGAANLGMALVVAEQVRSPSAQGTPQMGLGEALFLLFALVALYFGSYCFRVFKRKRTITPLEIGQTLVVLFVGLGGAAVAVHAREHAMLPLGVGCLVLATACYTSAYGFLPRLDPDRRNFLFFTLLGLALALVGCELLLPRFIATLVFAAIALLAGAAARRIASPVLYLHGAVYLLVAILRAGVPATIAHAFVGSSVRFEDWLNAALLLALTVTILYPWLPRPQGRAVDTFLGRRAVDLFLFIGVLACGGIVVSLLVKAAPLVAGPDAQRGALASLRTGVLALSAALLARFDRRARLPALSWMVYTILALGAIKLAFEDLRVGGAATLFLSLGLYGGALIVAPRFLRRR
jgi:hypothetical protein